MKIVHDWDDEELCYGEIEFSYPTEQELVREFPEARMIILLKLVEWREAKEDYLRCHVEPVLRRIKSSGNELEGWYRKEALKVLVSRDLSTINGHIARLTRLLNLMMAPERVSGAPEGFSVAVQKARSYSILKVVGSTVQLKKHGKKYMGRCPFHPDKTPSFFVYPDTNSFYCFGCQKGGDSIKYIEFHYGYDFKNAVRHLSEEE